MNDKIFLIFDKDGIKGMRKTLPPLRAGEYACRLDVSVDDKYFKRIIPIAKMELDDNYLIEPKLELEPIPKEDKNEETID